MIMRTDTTPRTIRWFLFIISFTLVALSTYAVFVKYVAEDNYVIETKPMDDFTEDDF